MGRFFEARGGDLFRSTTPLEQYQVQHRVVSVKREDLYGIPPAPPLAKLRGARVLLNRLFHEGVRLVGCWDTRVSRLGQGIAACAREFPGMRVIVSYPRRLRVDMPDPVRQAAVLGAAVYPVAANRASICFSQAARYVRERCGYMLPFGLDCPEAVEAIATEAATIPSACLAGGTLVLSAGSGVTLAGLLRGMPVFPKKVVAVSAGRSPKAIRECLERHSVRQPRDLRIFGPLMPYDAVPTVDCPFPSHPNYDLKAWWWLTSHLEHLPDPVLFWNIGA